MSNSKNTSATTSTSALESVIKLKAGTEKLTARVTPKVKEITTANAKASKKTVSRFLVDLINKENARINTAPNLAVTESYIPNNEKVADRANYAAMTIEPGQELQEAKDRAIFMLGLDYDITEEPAGFHISNFPVMKTQAQTTKQASFEELNEDLHEFMHDIKTTRELEGLPNTISCYLEVAIDPITEKQVLDLEIKYSGLFNTGIFTRINSWLEVRGFQPMAQTSSFIYAAAVFSQLEEIAETEAKENATATFNN